MTPTSAELRAAIEVGLDAIISRADGEESGDPGYERSAVILRAHLETFDEERAFQEAASEYIRCELESEESIVIESEWKASVAAYRALVAKRDGK
jgi:hypothetical protein